MKRTSECAANGGICIGRSIVTAPWSMSCCASTATWLPPRHSFDLPRRSPVSRRTGSRQTAMTPFPERSGPSSVGRCDIGRVAISTTDLSRTIAASKADVDRCWDWKAPRQRHAIADATTNCATSSAAGPGCANMFLLRRSAGSTCGRRRLPSISWQPPERVGTFVGTRRAIRRQS